MPPATDAPSAVPLKKLDAVRYQVPSSYKPGMRVPGLIYANEKLLGDILKDKAVQQVVNVAHLPGIVGNSMAMPDMHWGYGFPIGGVAATDIKEGGVISPGGVGFDINCGVRLVRTNFKEAEVRPHLRELMKALFQHVPAGVGSQSGLRLNQQELKQVLSRGARWAVEQGYGTEGDLEAMEDHGCIKGADPACVSERAIERGRKQCGTLGSGNHFLEVQVIDKIYEPDIARQLDLFEGEVVFMVHCGSRGLGYQVCDDFCRTFSQCLEKYHISVPDRQLACAPVESPEGREYFAAMRSAANFAFTNRQYILHQARQAFQKVFHKKWEELGIRLIYDVAHNIAKIENYEFAGREHQLCVHRKGATRAFPPGHPELAGRYRKIGQPVIIPGDMGRNSFLLIGVESARETFYSCCHGAGRVMSRSRAQKQFNARTILKELEDRGIIVQAESLDTITEEAPLVYKDVSEVVEVVQQAGLSKKVCRMRPMGVVKG